MSIHAAPVYDICGTAAAPATLTAALTDNTKTVLCDRLDDITIGVAYTPKAAQTNRYCVVTVEVSNYVGTGAVPDASFKPYSAALITTSPNEVDLVPVVSALGAGYGTPLVIPTNSTSPTSTGGVRYEATYNPAVNARWMRVSVMEDGRDNFGTAHVDIYLGE